LPCLCYSIWGEHEIDYVLFLAIPDAKNTLTIKPHPDEVDDVQWVTREALVEQMKHGLWSPWFRILAHKWLVPANGWWDNLHETMSTGKHCDYVSIHRFDPPKEHMGGKGNAGPYLGNNDVVGDTM